MNRNEITLQEMFSSVIGELREGGRWGTAHIYQSAVNAFSAFTKWQPMPMRRLSPTVLKRFENYLRQRNCSWNTVSTYIKTVRSVYHRAVDRKYIRYVPRLFEHVYTGTRADRKKALEASDISSLVRETERSLQRGTLPNTQQRTRIFFVLMFMLRGIPFVDLAYLHKRDLQGNVLSYRRRKTGRALTVSLTPEAMQMVRMVANRNPDSPYLFPILQSEEGTEAAYREYQSALRGFNQRLAVLSLTVSLTPEAMQMVRMVANRNPDSPYLFPILQSEEGTEAAYREYQSALRGFNQRLAVLRQCLGMQSAL
ncbi:site-specific integrase, partial [Bacteroides uniformis]|uniref:site-specific integrase n=1 Tax=Bacteroides uniformis TaxID=820 RepID=UPI00216AC700